MATYLADRVIVFTGEPIVLLTWLTASGQPSVATTATSPQGLLTGMNQFLEQLEITFRRDPSNYRPRINKVQAVTFAVVTSALTAFLRTTSHDMTLTLCSLIPRRMLSKSAPATSSFLMPMTKVVGQCHTR